MIQRQDINAQEALNRQISTRSGNKRVGYRIPYLHPILRLQRQIPSCLQLPLQIQIPCCQRQVLSCTQVTPISDGCSWLICPPLHPWSYINRQQRRCLWIRRTKLTTIGKLETTCRTCKKRTPNI